jgi:hypothetical protein
MSAIHLINARQQFESLASGAKALISEASYGGAEALPFRTTIHEMSRSQLNSGAAR